MDVKVQNRVGVYDGRNVPYLEMEVTGDKHTLSIRKYPKSVSIVMWKNSDKYDTRVSMKLPINKFSFEYDVETIIKNFDTVIDDTTMEILEKKWEHAEKLASF
jgi:hypothetical protein